MERNFRFEEGEKVYWNAGWNEHSTYDSKVDHRDNGGPLIPVGWMIRGPYDFGYYSKTNGKVILYEEGECNMQDSFCVFDCYVIKAEEYESSSNNG